MRITIASDPSAAARFASALISDVIVAAVAARGVASLALSGGSTPWEMMRLLAGKQLPWSAVHVFQTDERVVPLGDADRTWRRLDEVLLSRLVEPPHAHPMPVESDDLAAAAARYASLLRSVAGTPPVLDVVHLGLGADGHVASLLPDERAPEAQEMDVTMTGPYQGHRRMTLTSSMISRAGQIVWLVIGANKAGMLRRLVDGDARIPAGRISQAQATIVADQAAARELAR